MQSHIYHCVLMTTGDKQLLKRIYINISFALQSLIVSNLLI